MVHFDEFRFDPDSGDVWASGERIARLQEQPRLVLATLVARPHVLVSREELCRLLWPDGTLVDVENGLNIAINKVRLALRDSASTPRLIETVPRRGYRFIGSLREPAPVVEPPAIEPSSTPTPARRAWPRAALVGSTFLLVVVGLIWFRPASGASRPRIESVAVLSFENLLGDRDLDYLAEGLTDTINNGLARSGIARVTARESTSLYRERPAPIQEMARDLRVEAVVRGTLVRNGASYAVNVRLLNGTTERQTWTGRFERATVADLTVADDIVANLIRELGLPSRAVSRTPARPVSTAAHKELATGRYFFNQRNGDRFSSAGISDPDAVLEKAVVHFSRAIELQPDYAEAWSALAEAYAMGATTKVPALEPWPGTRRAAGTAAAQQAIQIDPWLGQPHAALGRFLLQEGRWQESESEHREAVTLSPQYSTGRQWYGTLLARLGKCDEARKQAQIGADIDPLTPLVNEAVASVYLMCGQPAQAIPILQRLLDMYPDRVSSIYRLGEAYTIIGEYQRAREVLEGAERWPQSVAVSCRIRVSLSDALVSSGKPAEGSAIARQIQKEASARADLRICGASASAVLGDTDAMFRFLDQARTQGEALDMLLYERRLVRYYRDPRYRVLLDEIGLLPYLANSPLGLTR